VEAQRIAKDKGLLLPGFMSDISRITGKSDAAIMETLCDIIKQNANGNYEE
jgi:hypothetical protein